MNAAWTDSPRVRAYALLVLLPTLVLAIYYGLVASDRYVSQARLVVEGDEALPISALALGFLGSGQSEAAIDAELVRSFIESPALLLKLEKELSLRDHYSQDSIDPFSRLSADASQEAFLDFYLSHVEVSIEEKAPIFQISVQAFDRAFAQNLAETITRHSETFVNDVGQSLAREQVNFVHGEVEKANDRLRQETHKLVSLQNQNKILDPVLEVKAIGQIIAGLQQELARLRAELKLLTSYLSPVAAEVVSMRKKIAAVESQIDQERAKQVRAGESDSALNDLVLEFKENELTAQVALDVYRGSLQSLEAAKLEASRKVKFLVRISPPTLPDESTQPRRAYNVATAFVLFNLLFWIGGLLLASIRDHRE